MKAPKKQTESAKRIQAAQKAASVKKSMKSDYKKQLKKEETGVY
jgi:hypothetical protein